VAPQGAAAAAGVQPGDVVLELQRKPVPTVDAFRKVARDVKPGDTVVFRVRRGGSALFLAAQAPRAK
jgi:serine protease Do